MPTTSFRYAAFVALALALLGLVVAQTPTAETPASLLEGVTDPGARDCLTKLAAPLIKANGQFSPEVRTAYIDWCWKSILHTLQAQQHSVSAECIAEVEQDPTLKVAMSAAVYPPDPSILQNYATLRQYMGASFTQKYRSLATAIAVARRIKGVESDLGENVGRENQVPIWAYIPLRNPSDEAERQMIATTANFMRSKGCTALELFNSEALCKQLTKYLAAYNIDQRFIGEVSRSPLFGERLKNAMILLHQRPPARTPKPTCIAWLKHLLSIYESKPASVPLDNGRPLPWPLFSIPDSPWPLMMSLSHPVAMDEATYLWEAFQGQHGPDRFHTYGPYRDDLTSMPDQLAPSRWFWNAVPDQIVHGGQCMPISLATLDLYSSLGKPAMDAAQPGHANLLVFHKEYLTWKATIEQDFCGGARVTYAQWFFDDQPRSELHFRDLFGWPCAEYHLGLAVGMNLGLSSYIDTRMASRIFDLLPSAKRKTIGMKLLTSAAMENPFNAEVWYRIGAEATNTKECFAVVQAVRDHDPKRLFNGQPSPALDAFMNSGNAGPAMGDINDYWNVLFENLGKMTLLAKGGPKDEASLCDAYRLLASVPGVDGRDLVSYTHRFVGILLPTSAAEAMTYDLNLAKQGDSFGCMRMGQRYVEGDGVPRDDIKARYFLSKAARQGNAVAAITLDQLTVKLPNDGVEVIASSTYSPTQDVHHLLDGAGMIAGVHDNSIPAATMWQTVDRPLPTAPAPGLPDSPAWVRFNFPKPRRFDAVEIWNQNQANLTDRGFRKLQIYGTLDGAKWTPLTKNAELPRAAGAGWEPSVLVPNLASGQPWKSVIIAASATDGNFGSIDYGLSAVRFVNYPVDVPIPAYQIQVQVSSLYSESQAAEHLINGAGMTGDQHDNHPGAGTMWQTVENPGLSYPAPSLYQSPGWVRFDFSTPQSFEAIKIWNGNQAKLTNRGFKKMRIYGTENGIDWFVLTSKADVQLPQASGAAFVDGNTFFYASPNRVVRSVLIVAAPEDGNYGGNAYALSAVRFIAPSSR